MTAMCQRVGLAILLIALVAPAAIAQQTGTIAGAVRDAQGGVLPGVTVTVRSDALVSGSQVVVTGEAGAYQFPTLPPGTYSVTYELTGFTPLRREGIVVQVARTTRLDVELSVGTLQETVTVSGESPVVDIEQHGDADQHQQGSLRGDSHRAQPVDDGGARAWRRHRASRRRRHRGRAAVQHRGVRIGGQPEVVQHRRPEGELGRRRVAAPR